MFKLVEPYLTRSIRYIDLWQLHDWRMKAYGIAYEREMPRAELISAAREITAQRLAQSSAGLNHYNVGYVGIHQGKTGNFVFVDWWAEENELHHHVYTSSHDHPEQLVYQTPTGLSACVWDLRLMCFERDAWQESVLEQYPYPDVEVYLARTLNADL